MRFPDDVPVLSSDDVTLRAHRPDDAAGVVEQCIDPVSVRWTTVPRGYTRSMADAYVTEHAAEAWESGRARSFAIEATHPDGIRRFSGSLSLRDEGDNRAELAFGAHPAVRGRGVTTRAVGLLLDYGFEQCGVETVIWYAERGNYASRRIAWKTGFTFGGTLRRWLPHGGEYVDGWSATLHKSDAREPQSLWYEIPVLHGDRVTLRAMNESDVPRIAEACADPRTQYWLAFMPRDYTEDDARDYLAALEEGIATGHWVQWAVVDPATDQLLAHVGIPRNMHGNGEIGYWAHPDARGRGVVTEAVRLVVRHAFLEPNVGGLGFHRLFLKAAGGNEASAQVAKANGFREFGVERRSLVLGDGSYADHVLFELLRSTWSERRGG
jgi:RimJ/RimL family protein N-acetyltransferase